MRFSITAAVLSALPLLASAANQTIMVGANNGLTFDPPSVNASVGDTLTFQFMSKNHTLTQSTFAAPCSNISDSGIDSGFQAVATNATSIPSFSFTVNDTSAPMWFYCRQTGHCAKGMVFAVNPTAAKSFDAFQLAANSTGSTASTSASASGSAASASSTAASTTANGAMSHGVRAGAVLMGLGVVAGLVL